MRWIGSLAVLAIVGCGPNQGKNNSGDGNDLSVSMMIDMAPPGCDAVKQDCATGKKCVLNVAGSNVLASGTCVPNGTVSEGKPCNQDSTVSNVLNDDCLAGLSCDNDGADGNYYCRKLCSSDTTCTTTGQKCAGIFDPNPVGLCLPVCTLFGTDCPAGSNCSVALSLPGDGNSVNGYFVCKTPGTVAPFASCMSDTDCGADYVCDGTTNKCTPVCDATHACNQQPADGGALSCQPIPNLSNGQGICG
jgi:hypothetical protein